MSDEFPADSKPVDPVIERMLSARARMHRAPEGLSDRIVRATAPSIAPPTYALRPSGSRESGLARTDAAAARLRRFALAASLALLAGVAVMMVLPDRGSRSESDGLAQGAGVPDPGAGLTDSEPVLVSLLAGSDVDPAGADEHPAEAILRVHDASFAELQGEVLMVVSAGVGTR